MGSEYHSEVEQRIRAGEPYVDLAKRFGISLSTVYYIRRKMGYAELHRAGMLSQHGDALSRLNALWETSQPLFEAIALQAEGYSVSPHERLAEMVETANRSPERATATTQHLEAAIDGARFFWGSLTVDGLLNSTAA